MKNRKILVSIGLPVFNGGDYLRIAIDSLLQQSYSNIELIISDNASTDQTAEVCRKYLETDKRVKYYRQLTNIGAIDNFNYVLSRANGQYFMWAAHDDRWHKDFIKLLLQSIITTGAVLAVPDYTRYDNGETTQVTLNSKNKFSRKESIIDFLQNVSRDNTIYVYGLMKTSMIKNVNGYHKDWRPYYHASDFITIIKILLSGKVTNVNENLFYKRIIVYYFRKFDVIRSLTFNKSVLKSIQRYLFDPVYNFLDLFYSVRYTLHSNLKFTDKLLIALHLTFYFFKNLVIFIFNMAKGLILLITSYIRRLLKS